MFYLKIPEWLDLNRGPLVLDSIGYANCATSTAQELLFLVKYFFEFWEIVFLVRAASAGVNVINK